MKRFSRSQHLEAILRAIDTHSHSKKIRGGRIEFSIDNETSKPPIVFFPDSQGFQDRRSGESSEGRPILWLARLIGMGGPDREVYLNFMERYGSGGEIKKELREAKAPDREKPGIPLEEIRRFYERSKRGPLEPAAQWLESRAIPATISRSLDYGAAPEPALIHVARKDIRRLMYEQGGAIVAPMRDTSGYVCNVLLRWYTFKEEDTKQRFLALNSLATPYANQGANGIPLMYGTPEIALNARILYVCEGMPDTYTAQALTYGRSDIAVIGASCASSIPKLEPWLSGFKGDKIVIIPHLDKWRLLKDGRRLPPVGMEAASKLANALIKLGIRASLFDMRALNKRFNIGAKDLNDLLKSIGPWLEL